MTVVHNILCLLVFTLNVSVIFTRIFPQTELKAPPQVTEFIKSIGRYPYCMNIDKF